VAALAERGDEVTVLVRARTASLAAFPTGVRVVEGSLDDTGAVAGAAHGAEVVYHLAGGVRGPGETTAEVLNVGGTRALLAGLARAGNTPVVVYASTGAVHGDRSGLWVTENHAPCPDTDYARSKLAAEDLLREGPVRARIARLGLVVGPGIRATMEDRLRAGRAWLPGEGTNHVPVVHLDDAVGALLHLGVHGVDDQVVHVAAPVPVTLAELYAAVQAHVGGTPTRFWSTWVPSAAQFALARALETASTRVGVRPVLTPDLLRLWTASVRLRTERLERELGYTWRWRDVRDAFAPAAG
jgi:UDP-glucose 4-epimerase